MEREVDELFAEYSDEKDELFNSPTDLSDSMPYELSWSAPSNDNDNLWVFWSQEDDNELRGLLGPLYPSVETSNSSEKYGTTKDRIRTALQSVRTFSDRFCSNSIIQFWTPFQSGDVIYLTTIGQCFGLTNLSKGLCSYRRHCVSNMLIPVQYVNELGNDEELNSSRIARAFRQERDEWTINTISDTTELDVKVYTVWPLFDKVKNKCIGVLEILSTRYGASFLVYDLLVRLKNVGLMPSWPVFTDVPIGWQGEGQEVRRVIIEDICHKHQLPFVQIWVSGNARRLVHRIFFSYQTNLLEWASFEGAFPHCGMPECEEVVGKAFASRGACFCHNVSMLGLVRRDPLLPNARKLVGTACFAICLESVEDGNFYILEFFLPPSGIDQAGGPISFVNMLVASLKMKIESSLGAHFQKLKDKLFVEVIKTYSDDELDSFVVCDTTEITRGKGNGFGKYSDVLEVDVDLRLSLGSWTNNATQINSEVQSNSITSDQEMSVDMHLVQPNPRSLFQRMSSDLDAKEGREGSTSFSYVRDDHKGQHRSSSSGTSEFFSTNDSDLSELNSFAQILRTYNGHF